MTDGVAQLRRYLAEIPELSIEASHYFVPGTAPQDPDARYGTTVYHIPIVSEIVDLLDERDKALDDILLNRRNGDRRLGVLPTLGLWVMLVWAELDDTGHEPRECCPARNHTIVGESGWLSEYAEPILELHPDFYRDIELLWTELRRACRVRREYVPRCPQCGWKLEGVWGNTDDAFPAWWRCTGCPKTFVRDAEVKRLALTQPRMALWQIASILQLPLRTLHHWRSTKRFQPDARGLYELEHVRRAALTAGRIEEEATA